jgi:fermentation-respiration switch protein FrsA (DUF1100 family)
MNENKPGVIHLRPAAAAMREAVDYDYYVPRDPTNLLRQDPARRSAVKFRSAGLDLAGHLYRPGTAGGKTRAIIMVGPISSVKEQTVPHYAQRFADAGYTVLTFDSRNFGESAGAPRWHYDPNEVIDDYSNAVSYLLGRGDIDPARIALVGVCMGGGYAVSAAARDRRVCAVAGIAGGYNIGGTFQQFLGAANFAAYFRKINELVGVQYRTGAVQYIPTIAPSLSESVPIAAMPNPEAFAYYDRTSKSDAPNWSNRITAASLQPYFIYNSIVHAPLVAPTPLLIVHGTKDLALLPEYAQAAYDAAVGPKDLVWIETHNHIELYDQDPYVSEACRQVLDWLEPHMT